MCVCVCVCVCVYIYKWRITGLFSHCVGLIYSAMSPPSVMTAIGQRPSTLAVELFYRETRACALCGAPGIKRRSDALAFGRRWPARRYNM